MVDRLEVKNSVDIDISYEKFEATEIVDMNDFEMLSLMIAIIAIIVKQLFEIISKFCKKQL